MKKIIFYWTILLIFIFTLISLSPTYAAALTDAHINSLNRSCIFKNFFDLNLTIDNSSNANYASSTQSVEFVDDTNRCIVGQCAKGYGTDSRVVHSNINAYSQMLNQTWCAWFNSSTSHPLDIIGMARRDDNLDGSMLFIEFLSTGNMDGIVYSDGNNPSAANPHDGTWEFICFGVNQTGSGQGSVWMSINGSVKTSPGLTEPNIVSTNAIYLFNQQGFGTNAGYQGGMDEAIGCNISLTTDELNYTWWTNYYDKKHLMGITPSLDDGNPPYIANYSDQGASCTKWNTNTSNPCNTTDTTPMLYFNTSEAAYCAMAANSRNYTEMGASRNCTAGEGASEHGCNLIEDDVLVYEDSTVYISCKDLSGNMNQSGKSTSGPLKINLTGLDAQAKNSIEQGIQNSLPSVYTIYTDQKVYARNSANTQAVGTFDKVVKKLSKIWAFNWIGSSESRINMMNITPVLYTLEFANVSSTNMTLRVELLINSTE